jgi:hypothetical protein
LEERKGREASDERRKGRRNAPCLPKLIRVKRVAAPAALTHSNRGGNEGGDLRLSRWRGRSEAKPQSTCRKGTSLVHVLLLGGLKFFFKKRLTLHAESGRLKVAKEAQRVMRVFRWSCEELAGEGTAAGWAQRRGRRQRGQHTREGTGEAW